MLAVLTQEGVPTVSIPDASGEAYEKPTRGILRTRELLEMYIGITQPAGPNEGLNTCDRVFSQQLNILPRTIYSSKNPYESSAAICGDIQRYDTHVLLESLKIFTNSYLMNCSESPNDNRSQTSLSNRSHRKVKETYCSECQHNYHTTSNYGKHRRDIHEKIRFHCSHPRCQKSFQRNGTRLKHERKCQMRWLPRVSVR